MAKKETKKQNNGNMELGEINTIRNILMGEQIAAFNQQLTELTDRITNLEAELNDKIQQASDQGENSLSNLERNVNQQFTQLENALEASFNKLSTKLDKVSKEDKQRLGKMLEKVSKQLIGE